MEDEATFADTIPQFCRANNISPSYYYELKKGGLAPVEIRLGKKKVIISKEAGAAWRRRMERLTLDAETSEADADAEADAA